MKSLPERLASTDKQQEFTKLFRCNPYVADEPEVVRGLGLFLIAVVIRFINRHYSTLPPFPASMSQRERKVASASEYFLYALLFVQPLVGWGMLSAARYPVMLYGSLHLFPVLPRNIMLYAVLRRAHTILAYLLFLTFLAHFARWNLPPYGAVEGSLEPGHGSGESGPRYPPPRDLTVKAVRARPREE